MGALYVGEHLLGIKGSKNYFEVPYIPLRMYPFETVRCPKVIDLSCRRTATARRISVYLPGLSSRLSCTPWQCSRQC